jgi:hypothetical protein
MSGRSNAKKAVASDVMSRIATDITSLARTSEQLRAERNSRYYAKNKQYAHAQAVGRKMDRAMAKLMGPAWRAPSQRTALFVMRNIRRRDGTRASAIVAGPFKNNREANQALARARTAGIRHLFLQMIGAYGVEGIPLDPMESG